MRRNIVLAILVVLAMLVWRIHVHHAQRALPAPETDHAPFRTAHAANTEPRAASIAGTVRDEAGAAIPGARVCASASSSALPGDLIRDARCAVTGATGAYTIASLYAADYQVSATAPHYALECYAPRGSDQKVTFPLAANEERRGVDIVLHRGGVEVSGTVTDAGGGTIAGARVRIDAAWQRYGAATAVVETDEHGHYSLWASPGLIGVTAVADGYATTTRPASAPAQLDLVLVPESVMSGTVVDAVTGDPVPDVTVNASSVETWGAGGSTRTDAQGRFTVSRLPPGRYTTSAHAPHGTGTSEGSTGLALGQHVDGVVVKLHPAHQIVGHVLADGKPCPMPGLALVDERQNLTPDVIVDPDGTLHADGVLPGVYLPAPTCDGYVHRDLYPPIVVVDRDVTASWTLTAGATVTGRIRTASGAPLAFADVGAWSVTTSQRVQTTYGADRTSREGEYTVRGLRPGHYQLGVSRAVTSTMGSPFAAQIDLEITGTETLHRDVVVPDAGGSITGRITTAQGSPGRVYVQARQPDGNSTLVASDDAGRYEIHAVAAGSYELVVLSGADHGLGDTLTAAPTTIAIHEGEAATVNFVVAAPAGVIRGRVVDDRGEPVSDAFIGLAFEQDQAPALRGARDDGDGILVGSDGRFAVEHLTKGPYTVRASRKDGGEVIAAHVALGSDITLVLKPAADVAGIAHRSGGPIDDLHVSVYDRDTEARVREEVFFRTGGKFAVHDLAAGHYRVVVATGGSEHAELLDLAEGQHATLDVELEGVVTLVGRAVDARSHAPVAGILVSANLAHASTSFTVPSDLRDVSDATGRFEVPNVPRGELDIYGRTFDEAGRTFDPVTLHRVVAASDPEVVDLGDVWVVTSTPESRCDAGVTVEVGDDRRVAKVGYVDSDGPAARAGIVVGDVITAIDGVDTTGDGAVEASTLLTGEAGTELAITLERGETVTVVLSKP